MKLPWNKKYCQISLHVIFTILIIYILGLMIGNIGTVTHVVGTFMGTALNILLPLVVALIFAYIFNPMVEFYQKKWDLVTKNRGRSQPIYKRRFQGAVLTYITIALIFAVAIQWIVAKIGSTDATELAKSINDSIEGFSDMLVLLQVKLADWGVLENVDGMLQSGIETITNFVTASIMGMANSVSKAGNLVINSVIGVTVAFYLLTEKEKILFYVNEALDVFLKENHSKAIKSICTDTNTIFSGYIGGQILDATILAVMTSVTFSLIGIRYPIIIGVVSGICNIVPYIGAFVAFVLSVGVGLLSGAPIKALYAAIAVLVIQQIDGMFVVPKVVGKSVELHPVLVILSLSIFGGLFGILGMIIAVPCTAILKVLIVRFYQRKRAEKNT